MRVTVPAETEAIIRRCIGRGDTCVSVGVAIGKSTSWVRAACKLLDIETKRMRAYRVAAAKRSAK